MDFQSVILALQNYWSDRHCLIVQPYDTEKGAGTMSPHTFLRAIGPEPWSVAYVEPCRRPTDGRFGENPNRLQHYYQFQVLLKPSPDDVLDQYLNSLKMLGIDPADHDIRFVEDDWESPTGGMGCRLGGVVRWHGNHPIHLLSASRWLRLPSRLSGNHLWTGAPHHVSPRGEFRF